MATSQLAPYPHASAQVCSTRNAFAFAGATPAAQPQMQMGSPPHRAMQSFADVQVSDPAGTQGMPWQPAQIFWKAQKARELQSWAALRRHATSAAFRAQSSGHVFGSYVAPHPISAVHAELHVASAAGSGGASIGAAASAGGAAESPAPPESAPASPCGVAGSPPPPLLQPRSAAREQAKTIR
jgi:hypothetical protein